MRREWKRTDFNGEVVFDRYLGGAHYLDVVQELLMALAPRWCSRLRVYLWANDQRAIDVAEPTALRSAVISAAGERGPTYRRMVERHGAGDERVFGSVELRVRTPS